MVFNIELYKSSGLTSWGKGLVSYLMSLNSSYNKVVKGGPSGMKDFKFLNEKINILFNFNIISQLSKTSMYFKG